MPLTNKDFILKRNDTLPNLNISLSDSGCLGRNEPFDLTGATGVTFTMINSHGEYKIAKKDAQIISSSGGTIQYNWDAEDTNEAGTFKAEFQLNYNDGGRLTVPQKGFLTIIINNDITFD